MKYIKIQGIFFLVAAISFSIQCGGRNYGYNIKISGPKKTGSNCFADAVFNICFVMKNDRISIKIENKSTTAIAIKWDKMAITDTSGNSKRIIHEGVKYSEKENGQVPSIVPAGSKLEDSVTPADNISWAGSTSGQWDTRPILKNKGGIGYKAYIGKEMGLLVVIESQQRESEYNFKILIENIVLDAPRAPSY